MQTTDSLPTDAMQQHTTTRHATAQQQTPTDHRLDRILLRCHNGARAKPSGACACVGAQCVWAGPAERPVYKMQHATSKYTTGNSECNRVTHIGGGQAGELEDVSLDGRLLQRVNAPASTHAPSAAWHTALPSPLPHSVVNCGRHSAIPWRQHWAIRFSTRCAVDLLMWQI